MTKRSIIIFLVTCTLTAVLAVQVISQPRSSTVTLKQSDAERNSRTRLDAEQRRKEFQEFQERVAKERKEFLRENYALGASEEQWKVIKAKLEKVRLLREQARFTVGVSLTSSSGSRAGARANVPVFQWKRPWKGKAGSELTEAQKLAKQLIALVESKYTTLEQFGRTMDALRKARSKEVEIERQLADARKELREVLTTRQEAVLVLMRWL